MVQVQEMKASSEWIGDNSIFGSFIYLCLNEIPDFCKSLTLRVPDDVLLA
jgi:hypothetical protein